MKKPFIAENQKEIIAAGVGYSWEAFESLCWENYLMGRGPITPSGPGGDYGIVINKVIAPPGTWYFKVLGVDHLACGENNFRHHIFMTILDEEGKRHSGINGKPSMRGGDSAGIQHLVVLDKPDDEAMGNLAMWCNIEWHRVWAHALGPELEIEVSESVDGLSSRHPDECNMDVTMCHHSFYIVGAYVQAEESPPPPGPEPDVPPMPEWESMDAMYSSTLWIIAASLAKLAGYDIDDFFE